MFSPRTCLCLLSLLIWARCNSEKLVLISIPQWPENVTRIQIDSTLDGRAGQPIDLRPTASVFGIALPEKLSGELILRANGMTQHGLTIATGSLQFQIHPKTVFPFHATLDMTQISCAEPSRPVLPTRSLCSDVSIIATKPYDSYVRGIWGSGKNDIWAVGGAHGDNGFIAHWNGSKWSTVPSSAGRLASVWGSGPNDVWAVGGTNEVGTIQHWDGLRWTVSTSMQGIRHSVWGSGPNDVWTVGDFDPIFHWDGSSWSKLASPTMAGVASIWGTGPADAWAVNGSYAGLMHWDGRKWSFVTDDLHVFQRLSGLVTGSGPDDIWLRGDEGAWYHWNGMGWSPHNFREYGYQNALWSSRLGDTWIVGNSGKLLHWDGTKVEQVDTGLTNSLSAIWGSESDDFWIGDSGGRVLHFRPCAPISSDLEAPTFPGLSSATRFGTCVSLGWEVARDHATPSGEIVYDIHRATEPGRAISTTPIATTQPGITRYSFIDPHQDSNLTYYFVVRARDQAGNRDTNTVEKSFSLPKASL